MGLNGAYAARRPSMTYLKSWSNTQMKVPSPALSCNETLSFNPEVLTDPILNTSLLTPLVHPIQKYFANIAVLGVPADYFILEIIYNDETEELKFNSPQKFDIKTVVNKLKRSTTFLKDLKKALLPYKDKNKLVVYIPIENFILNTKSDALDIEYMEKQISPLDVDLMPIEKSPYDLNPGQTVFFFNKSYKIHTYDGIYESVKLLSSDKTVISVNFNDLALTWGDSGGYKVGELVDYFNENYVVVGIHHVGPHKGKLVIKSVKTSNLVTLTSFTLATYSLKK